MLGKIILCGLMGAAFPVWAQNAPLNNASTSQEQQSQTVSQQDTSDKKGDTSNYSEGVRLAREAYNMGNEARVAKILQERLKKDVNLGPYEAKLIYRQLMTSKQNQDNKIQSLKQMADSFKYTDEQAQKAEAMYDEGKRPIEYQLPDNKDGEFESFIASNPREAMQQLVMSAPVNMEFSSEKMKISNKETQVAVQSDSQNKTKPVQSVLNIKRKTPIQSVISLSGGVQQPVVKQEKRLGIKSYGINPDNFY